MSFRLVGVYVTTGCDFFSGCQPADRIVDVTGPRGNVVTVALSTFQCWINKSMNNRLKIRIDRRQRYSENKFLCSYEHDKSNFISSRVWPCRNANFSRNTRYSSRSSSWTMIHLQSRERHYMEYVSFFIWNTIASRYIILFVVFNKWNNRWQATIVISYVNPWRCPFQPPTTLLFFYKINEKSFVLYNKVIPQ